MSTDKTVKDPTNFPPLHKDYYEAWRVKPGKTFSDVKRGLNGLKQNQRDDLNKDKLLSVMAGTEKVSDLKPNDWFLLLRVHAADQLDVSGSVSFQGEVFYVDAISQLPAGWALGVNNGVPFANYLMAINAPNYPASASAFKFFTQVTQHNISFKFEGGIDKNGNSYNGKMKPNSLDHTP